MEYKDLAPQQKEAYDLLGHAGFSIGLGQGESSGQWNASITGEGWYYQTGSTSVLSLTLKEAIHLIKKAAIAEANKREALESLKK